MVKAEVICSMQKRNKEGRSKLDKEIKIEIHKYKHLFLDESIKQLYKTRVQNYTEVSYGGLKDTDV
jgi:hypothetical protein